MPVTVSQSDLQAQVSINLIASRNLEEPMASSALRLARIWAAQLPASLRRDIEIAENANLSDL